MRLSSARRDPPRGPGLATLVWADHQPGSNRQLSHLALDGLLAATRRASRLGIPHPSRLIIERMCFSARTPEAEGTDRNVGHHRTEACRGSYVSAQKPTYGKR